MIDVDAVLIIAPEFASLEPEVIQAHINIAVLYVNPSRWLQKTDSGILYYTAHLLSISVRRGLGSLKRIKTGGLEEQYATSDSVESLGSSTYGQIFYGMMRTIHSTPLISGFS
jgi:hypothetical protein